MRPRFVLTDEQAKAILAGLPNLLQQYPFDGRSNRPFVAGFIRLIYHATGELYGVTIYRRLLEAYAPDRKPSNDTLSQEKSLLQEELLPDRRITTDNVPSATDEQRDPAMDVGQVIDAALQRHLGQWAGGAAVQRQMQERIDYLQEQLLVSGQIANDARSQAARLAAELQEARGARALLQVQVDVSNALLVQFGAVVDDLTAEMAGVRRFLMGSMDAIRGETRAWKERCADMESQLQESKILLEEFRRTAYARGASIPARLTATKT